MEFPAKQFKLLHGLSYSLVFLALCIPAGAVKVIRYNQLGYLPDAVKVAVYLADEGSPISAFTVHDGQSGQAVFTGKTESKNAESWGMKVALRLDFSEVKNEGTYFIRIGETQSPAFEIGAGVYEGTADFILNYLRQQRCGYNPFLKDSCHLHDGIIVYLPEKEGEFINVTGGWHDATDYLQYAKTSVNALFQMMVAWEHYPEVYGDEFNASGEQGANGIPDILDEIRWGLSWALKMNPAPGEFYHQIADDRDHVGFRLPVNDKADYQLGRYRPVYHLTGEPQGLGKYRNNTTGVSSAAGKFATAFAQAAMLFSENDRDFAAMLKNKAIEAFEFALSDTGYTQTACMVSPYFYEETSYADDLELAAIQLFRLTGDQNYMKEALWWGRKEPVTPWMEHGTARHYQYYPFVNLGHYYLAGNADKSTRKEFAVNYEKGLQYILERGKNDPFLNGIPYIWCSNNLIAAALTQARLYQMQTGNDAFAEMEAALRDWLFGCNPWGTAMICGLPGVKDSPELPHSSYTVVLGGTTPGGLVDGPVSAEIFNGLIGIELKHEDEYAAFNKGKAVYHDDIGDYSTNEPTMDGTASLSFYLAWLESAGRKPKPDHED